MKECAEKKQVRYFGLKKIDNTLIKKYFEKATNKIDKSRTQLVRKFIGLKGRLRKFKRKLEEAKTPLEKKGFQNNIKKTISELENIRDMIKELHRVKRMISKSNQ